MTLTALGLDESLTASRILQKLEDEFAKEHDFSFMQHAVCVAYAGSHSHGTSLAPDDPHNISDTDIMAVVLPPPEYTLGLKQFDHWVYSSDDLDVTCYSLHKFIRLLLGSNPNVIVMLWLRAQDYLLMTPTFERLIELRRALMTKAVYKPFKGYAEDNLKKMTSYTPAIDAEIRMLTDELAQAGWKLSEVMDRRALPMPVGLSSEEATQKANRLRSLRAQFHAAYMGEKRRDMVRKFGYDVKNAAHLLRLLTMCIEVLNTGTLQVYRTTDADVYKSIKRGEWTLDAVKARADALAAEAEAAFERCTLAVTPDFELLSKFVCREALALYR